MFIPPLIWLGVGAAGVGGTVGGIVGYNRTETLGGTFTGIAYGAAGGALGGVGLAMGTGALITGLGYTLAGSTPISAVLGATALGASVAGGVSGNLVSHTEEVLRKKIRISVQERERINAKISNNEDIRDLDEEFERLVREIQQQYGTGEDIEIVISVETILPDGTITTNEYPSRISSIAELKSMYKMIRNGSIRIQ